MQLRGGRRVDGGARGVLREGATAAPEQGSAVNEPGVKNV